MLIRDAMATHYRCYCCYAAMMIIIDKAMPRRHYDDIADEKRPVRYAKRLLFIVIDEVGHAAVFLAISFIYFAGHAYVIAFLMPLRYHGIYATRHYFSRRLAC